MKGGPAEGEKRGGDAREERSGGEERERGGGEGEEEGGVYVGGRARNGLARVCSCMQMCVRV
jgi:hypothetical protein